MTNLCAAVFVFNHRFDRNVGKLDALYAERFSLRRFLMPFWSGADDNRVVGVYETSWNFSGHMAQAASMLRNLDCSHIAFIGDDLIINPAVDELNLLSELGIGQDSGYIKNLASVDGLRYKWHRALQETLNLRRSSAGFDFWSELPAPGVALERLREHGVSMDLAKVRNMDALKFATCVLPRKIGLSNVAWIPALAGKPALYPLVSGYSDFVVVPRASLERFLHYCGVFAALGCFAEVAVPTSLALSCGHIVTELPINTHFMDEGARNGGGRLRGVEMWSRAEATQFSERFAGSLDLLKEGFPSDALYVHPIKLSMLA